MTPPHPGDGGRLPPPIGAHEWSARAPASDGTNGPGSVVADGQAGGIRTEPG